MAPLPTLPAGTTNASAVSAQSPLRKSSKFRSLTPSRTVVAAASTHSNHSQQKSPHRENSSHVSGGSGGGDERAFTPQKHAKKHVLEIDASNNAIAIKESALVPTSSDVDADTDTEDKVSTLEGKRDDAVTEEEVVEEEVDQHHETTNKQELESNAAADVVQDRAVQCKEDSR